MSDQTVSFLDGAASGHLVRPDGDGAGPGLVVIQEWWGVVPHMKDVAGRFAAEGHLALIPDLYHGKTTVEQEEAQHLMEGLDWDLAVKEITGAVQYLRDQGCAKVGVVGFCMGGALSVLAAAHAGVDAAVSFYGFPDPKAVAGTAAPTQIFFGEHEEFFNVDDARAWVDSQKEAGKDSALTIFPGTGHAFFNDTRPEVYHETSAREAWGRALAHFAGHLRG